MNELFSGSVAEARYTPQRGRKLFMTSVIKYTEINLKLNQNVKSNKGNSLLTVKVCRNETPGDPNLFNLCLDVQRAKCR